MLEVAEKLLIVPFVTAISLAAKFVVALLEVKVIDKVELSELAPVTTSAAVMVIARLVPSKVQLNCVAAVLLFPAASVNFPPTTFIVVAPEIVGVNVAV